MMGIEVISFTLKEVTDNVDHLESLGRAEIADAAKEAAIGNYKDIFSSRKYKLV